jgi:predicted protein tyrosine phosphatase
MDAQWVTPKIMVGAALQAADLSDLVAIGITHICDVTMHDDDDFLQASQDHPAINCLWIATSDDGQDKTQVYKPIAVWFLGAWLDPKAKFVFHCDGGCNRGPSACYMALRLLDWLPTAAEEQLRAVRPVLRNNAGCLRYMESAENALKQLGYT